MVDTTELTIKELAIALQNGSVSSLEATNEYLAKIEQSDKEINGYISVNRNQAQEMAKAADKKLATGSKEPLLGIPVAVKDLILQKGSKTTCGSKMLQNFESPYNSFVVKKLIDAGAVLLGKLNLDEFAMGSSCETSYFGPTKNPWDLSRAPGGSSGGSAAAVSARLAAATLGSDTGGSIRQPAALTGVVGLKPTYGRVSRFGLVAFASSLDQIGPLTKSSEDAAIMLNVIAGFDPQDSTSADIPVPDYTLDIDAKVEGLNVGIPKEYFDDGVDPEIKIAIGQSIEKLRKLGAIIKDVSLPHTKYAIPTYYVIASAEASSNLARYDAVRYGHRAKESNNIFELFNNSRSEGFGAEVKRRIMLGTYVLSSGYYDAYYLKAQKVRTLIINDFNRVFKDVDILLTPTSPTVSFKLNEKIDDPVSMYLSDILTINANLAGIPGLSVPIGLNSQSLPIGAQLLGGYFSESILLRVGKVLENILSPPLFVKKSK
ncbi:MAG: Asp-tRNA(Asn)/Glu-tRNA(Gln) amidotransferase subunit GatA [Nitrospinota bacterium]